MLAKRYGVKKFIHASTGSVYGEPVIFPSDETHPLNPCSYYGVSKLAGERYVNMYHKIIWCWHQESNPGPTDYKSVALPAELYQQKNFSTHYTHLEIE